ncbi:tripartite tricarboxylate transporter substrate binding protein [Azohydromonas australica]|uniref:tripartite tricarboxylate transporter substrate binding protein n=1 Tax=Azohydromonas australica TaxID=364039 RepID=UPI00041C1F26|nr:tripartite tricarboxylate transporter substrate binding protein [Azohydromonas australica]
MNRFAAARRGLLAAACLLPLWAAAQPGAWPAKPVKLIVPFAPGGPTDLVARLLAERLQAQWGQPVVVDYKPGAGTMLGTDFVAKSAPDGYTLGMAITAHMINPALQPKLPYDTTKDLVGVAQVSQAHFGLFAHPSLPVSNVSELIAYAKKNPGKLSYATPGMGTGTHLAGEMLNHMAGIDMVHVPYKGSAAAQQDVLGGRVPLLFDVLFSSMPFVKDGKLKVIALSSPKRALASPDIPLVAETVPGFSAMSFIGVIAPAGVPRPLLNQISADIGKAVRSTELSGRLVELGMEPVGSSPEAYDAVIRSEIDKWSRVVKAANIKPE